ncbi:helix-turn-helix transcriptional regulator [Clostridium perfringens]|nr:helix-turn-helix transcriptional regulator [Clostridium perfringens]MDK0793861.1 helix-turn-helix transcriptional regulator [Clostridium perfringens]
MDAAITELGKLIKNKRLELNYTTEDLANKMEKSTGFINNLENGKTDTFNIKLLSKLCKTLDISIPSIIPNYTDNFDNKLLTALDTNNENIIILSKTLNYILNSTDSNSFNILINKLNNEIEYFNKLSKLKDID